MSKKHAGVWIDRKRAIVVVMNGEKDTIQTIDSDLEKHVRLAGGSRSQTPYGPQDVASESKVEARRKQQRKRYYKMVIDVISDARRILIMGPGVAKLELEKEISKQKRLADRIIGIETEDKMTDHQIMAKVKKFFVPGNPS